MKSSRNILSAIAVTGFAIAGAAATTQIPVPARDSDALQVARLLNRAFIEVTEAVSPSVVVITVTQKPDPEEVEQMRSFRRLLPPGAPEEEPEPVQGQGSGVIIRPEGYIVTNYHVVSGAERIRVRLQDGREYDATVRGSHKEADLAVLHIKGASTNLPAARFGDSEKIRVGEFAIAVGAPYELDYSVTFGHVSAKGRGNLYGGPLEQDFIQTDASINFGNSGGPLVNLEGEVIGINSMIRGVGTGIGFAIPANHVREISDRIIAEGSFTRSWLGIAMPSPFDLQRLKADLPGLAAGVMVKAIQPDGPASRSTLEPGDIITAVDGKSVRSSGQLVAEVARKVPGREIQLEVLRDEQALTIRLKPEPMPEGLTMARASQPHDADAAPASDGATLKQLTPELAQEFEVNGMSTGVLVTDVAKKSPAEAMGFVKGDVITAVNGKAVATPRDFRRALKLSKTKRARVSLHRDGARTLVFYDNRSE